MWRPASIGALASLLFAFLAAPTRAQYPAPRNAELNKKASDFVNSQDAAAILGTPVETFGDGVIQCQFKEPSDINRPGFDKVLTFAVRYWDPPLPNDLAMRKQNLAEYPAPGAIVTELSDFADAALWVWVPGFNGTLYAFQGGTIAVEVTLTGFPEDVSLQDAKLLAARPLGGSGGTGFVYDGSLRDQALDADIAETIAALEGRWKAARTTPAETVSALLDQALVAAQSQPVASQPAASDSSTAPPAPILPRFSEATYITQSGFLHALKEVSLSVSIPRALSQYLTEEDARADVAAALVPYGISVVPVSTVRLEARLLYFRTSTDWRDEVYHTHEFLLTLDFITTIAVRRQGVFHVMYAVVAGDSGQNSIFEANETRKLVFGDELTAEMKGEFPLLLDNVLATIAANTAVDAAPWYPDAWTDEQRAAADAEFIAAMSVDEPANKHFDGIDSAPAYTTYQPAGEQGLLAPWDDWRARWTSAFQDLGWVKEPAAVESPLMLVHFFHCDHVSQVNVPDYYRLMSVMQLKESNAVFLFDGRVVRKPATLASWRKIDTILSDDLDDYGEMDVDEAFTGQIDEAIDGIESQVK